MSLYHIDCIKHMENMVSNNERVDAIITDPPYLYLNHKLDVQFNEELFFELAGKLTNKIIFFGRGDSFYKWNLLAKENGFDFKEELIWNKKRLSSFMSAVGRSHETISVRCKNKAKLNKVFVDAVREYIKKEDFASVLDDLKKIKKQLGIENSTLSRYLRSGEVIMKRRITKHKITGSFKTTMDRGLASFIKYERGAMLKTILDVSREHYNFEHPTQKPVELLRILIKLISNEGDLIFDPFMGSGSTGVACKIEGRKFMGCEIDDEYFKIASRRVNSFI